MKVLNMRKRRDRVIPNVQATINSRNNARISKENVDPPAFGMASYLPSSSISEDTDSIVKHQAFMKNQLRKRTPDSLKIDASMTATFNDRRKLIVTDSILIAELKEIYPAICDCHQV